MKVAVIGANGQLGTDLVKVFAGRHEVIELTHADIEIGDIDSVQTVLTRIAPQLVLSTAAAHNVAKCESDPDGTFRTNTIGALNLARVSADLDCTLLQYSTDYVFDGTKRQPYTETDAVCPQSVYAVSKYAGEQLVRSYCERYFVVRVSAIYGASPCRAKGSSFVSTMVRLAREKPEVRVVADEVVTPTWTKAIAQNTLALIETEAYDVYHMTCEGQASWYDVARLIFETLQLETPLYKAKAEDFPSVAKRPSYSVLDNGNLKKLGINQMPDWREALVSFLQATYSSPV